MSLEQETGAYAPGSAIQSGKVSLPGEQVHLAARFCHGSGTGLPTGLSGCIFRRIMRRAAVQPLAEEPVAPAPAAGFAASDGDPSPVSINSVAQVCNGLPTKSL